MTPQDQPQQTTTARAPDTVGSPEWKAAIEALRQRSFKIRILIDLFQWLANCRPRTRLALGRFLTFLVPFILRRRVSIVRRNIELCFPELTDKERRQIIRDHLRALTQSFVDRSVFWFGSADTIRAMISSRGHEQVAGLIEKHGAVMILAPHFVGLDAAATRLTLEGPEGATMYSPQRDPDIDALVRLGRTRFNIVHMVSRHEGIRSLIRYISKRMPIYYLPDMDFGRRGAVFVPFFGVQTATQTATAQIARKWKLPVLPVSCFWDPKTGLYSVEVGAPLEDFPGDETSVSLEVATARLNHHLETWVRQCPSQYYWVHRRFKTRPEGEPKIY